MLQKENLARPIGRATQALAVRCAGGWPKLDQAL